MTALPTISMAAWRAGDREQQQRCAAAVDAALREVGFLLITDHDVSDDLAALVRAHATDFFHLEPARKEQYRCRVGGRGWIPPGAESNSNSIGVQAPPDLKETFKVGLSPTDDPENTTPDVWPAAVPALRSTTTAYVAEVWRLARDLFTVFEQALDLPTGTFTEPASAAASTLNINYYGSLNSTGAVQDGQFRIGAHSDFGVLTILDRQVGYGGLQIQTPDGRWTDAPDVPGALTINIGDMLARWTGDRWRSTVHRVLPPSVEDSEEVLLSLVNFCGVRPTTLLRTLRSDAPTDYEHVLAGDYLRSKLEAIDVAPSR